MRPEIFEFIPQSNQTNSNIGVVGVNFKTAPIAVRENLVRNLVLEKLNELKDQNSELGSAEFVLLSTCNRVEIYYYSRDSSPKLPELLEILYHQVERSAHSRSIALRVH
jgi:glutamyl-tRNA reductase